jgi:hypothetical protein
VACAIGAVKISYKSARSKSNPIGPTEALSSADLDQDVFSFGSLEDLAG